MAFEPQNFHPQFWPIPCSNAPRLGVWIFHTLQDGLDAMVRPGRFTLQWRSSHGGLEIINIYWFYWLVVSTYPSKKKNGLRQLGWWHSQYDGKVKKNMFQTTNQSYRQDWTCHTNDSKCEYINVSSGDLTFLHLFGCYNKSQENIRKPYDNYSPAKD